MFTSASLQKSIASTSVALIAVLSIALAGCANTAQRSPEIAHLETISQSQVATIPTGKSSFMHRDAMGRDIRVFSYKPESFSRDAAIWFTMHGLHRDAEKARDEWLTAADQNGLLILAPEFSEANFPKSADYTLGKVTGDDFSRSNYAAIEHIFDSAVAATSSNEKSYSIFGHSAGGQFVQKMLLLMPKLRVNFAISANPGWYVLPTCTEVAGEAAAFPYSFAQGPYSIEKCPAALARGLSRNVLLMLGAEDWDATHPQLSKTAGAMLQGANRFDRGIFFMEKMRRASEVQQKNHTWRVQVVPGVGHNASEMAQSAIFLTYRTSRRR